jgi:hypothetical protein
MPSTLERSRSARSRLVLTCILFTLLTLSVVLTTGAGTSVKTRGVSVQARLEETRCPAGEVAIAPADVGVGDVVRCLPVRGDELEVSHVDPLYGRIAGEIVERMSGLTHGGTENVKVICWNEQDWLTLSDAFRAAGLESLTYRPGWAPVGRGVINLSHHVCGQLDRIAYDDAESASLATGAAVGTLAHEAVHVSGIEDEGVTDCYAMQLTAVTASGLGAGSDDADLLQVKYAEFNRQHKSGTEYDSPDCYDGGPLDIDPGSSRWP